MSLDWALALSGPLMHGGQAAQPLLGWTLRPARFFTGPRSYRPSAVDRAGKDGAEGGPGQGGGSLWGNCCGVCEGGCLTLREEAVVMETTVSITVSPEDEAVYRFASV